MGTAQEVGEDHAMLYPLLKQELLKEHHFTPNALGHPVCHGAGAWDSAGWAWGQARHWAFGNGSCSAFNVHSGN